MIKVRKTVWRSSQTHKDLLILEPGKLTVTAYDVTPQELDELIHACEEAKLVLADIDPATKVNPVAL